MEKKKEDIIIKLIKNAKPDVPNKDFTSSVMEQLSVDVETELNTDITFSNLLNTSKKISLSDDFTKTVLSDINYSRSKTLFKPIIKKRMALFFIFSIITLTILSFIVKGEASYQTKTYNLNFLYEALNNSPENMLTIFVSVISLSTLLLIEYIYKKKFSKQIKVS